MKEKTILYGEFESLLAGINHVKLNYSVEINTCFVIVSKKIEALGNIVFVDNKSKIIRYILISPGCGIVPDKWINQYLQNHDYNAELEYFIYLYYTLIYLRKDTAEYILAVNFLREYYKNTPLDNVLLEKMREYNYDWEYCYQCTRYLNRSVLKDKTILFKYYLRRIRYFSKQKVTRFLRRLIVKTNSNAENIILPANCELVRTLQVNNSASGCKFFLIKDRKDKTFFFKSGEIRQLNTVKKEKYAANRIFAEAKHKEFYLTDYAPLDSDYLMFPFMEEPTFDEYVVTHDFDKSHFIDLIKFFENVLDDLYEMKIIHRDIRPENIMVCSGGYPLYTLIDFGCSYINEVPIYLTNRISIDDYHTAGINCRAGANIWDDAGSAYLMCEMIADKFGFPKCLYDSIKNRIGRFVCFEYDV